MKKKKLTGRKKNKRGRKIRRMRRGEEEEEGVGECGEEEEQVSGKLKKGYTYVAFFLMVTEKLLVIEKIVFFFSVT